MDENPSTVRTRAWRAANPERAKAQAHDHYVANKETKAEQRRLLRASWTPEQWAIHRAGQTRRQKAYVERHGIKTDPVYGRRHYLKKQHNLTIDQWEALFEWQGRKCVVCETPDFGAKPHTDHDPKTGYIRGILCHRCNLALGNVQDSVARLGRLIDYLQRNALSDR